MNILLLGSGGREHALAWKIHQSKLCSHLYIAPGNAGTAEFGKNIPVNINDFSAIEELCSDYEIELMVVGPEEPLVNGIADHFANSTSNNKIQVIGPSQKGSQLEGSKSFAKKFMQRHHIPTAVYREFDSTNYEEGIPYLQKHALPIVLKADGLAAGKGVIICQSHLEAMSEYELMIQQSKFGEAGRKVVVEDFLDGIELSVFVLTDGKNYILFPEAKDYKKVGEADKGANTGGMGAISPVPFADEIFMKKIEKKIIAPTIKGLINENIDYKGFIFFGLIKVGSEPFLIEYNCRMGDPETEVVIPRLKNDIVELFKAIQEGTLNEITISKDERSACTIMAVSGGYPGNYEKGYEIMGLDKTTLNGSMVFHAGTKVEDNKIVTNGGRVLCVTSYGNSISEAARSSREILKNISFEDMYFRRDIGYEFVD